MKYPLDSIGDTLGQQRKLIGYIQANVMADLGLSEGQASSRLSTAMALLREAQGLIYQARLDITVTHNDWKPMNRIPINHPGIIKELNDRFPSPPNAVGE